MPPATPLAANGQWTLAAGDFAGGDVGTITNWSISVDYTTPGNGTQVLSYAWSPLAGLYTNTIATNPLYRNQPVNGICSTNSTDNLYSNSY
ncbi:MAG: hypothetical protein IPF72_03910 [Chitinophagaceae bacterium]|nr:hypothetical protein [Chitinophagaceae bacterium]